MTAVRIYFEKIADECNYHDDLIIKIPQLHFNFTLCVYCGKVKCVAKNNFHILVIVYTWLSFSFLKIEKKDKKILAYINRERQKREGGSMKYIKLFHVEKEQKKVTK